MCCLTSILSVNVSEYTCHTYEVERERERDRTVIKTPGKLVILEKSSLYNIDWL